MLTTINIVDSLLCEEESLDECCSLLANTIVLQDSISDA